MNKNFCEIKMAAKAENVALSRIILTNFLSEKNLLLSELDEIKVAVSEAVSNAIIHGYENDESRTVMLRFDISGDFLQVQVQDWGCGIDDIEKAMAPEYSRLAERMGLGFCFMQNFMDSVEVKSEAGKGTTVSMSKHLLGKSKEEI